MKSTILTLSDSNGSDGQVLVWYSEYQDRETYDTPACHELFIERYRVLTTEDFTPEFDEIQRALEEEIENN